MPDNKERLLGELYGLRAGLSAISQNNDKVRRNEHLIVDSGTTIKSSESRIDEERKDIADRKSNIPHLQKRAIEIQHEIEQWKQDEKKRYKERMITVTNHNLPKDDLIAGLVWFPALIIVLPKYFIKKPN